MAHAQDEMWTMFGVIPLRPSSGPESLSLALWIVSAILLLAGIVVVLVQRRNIFTLIARRPWACGLYGCLLLGAIVSAEWISRWQQAPRRTARATPVTVRTDEASAAVASQPAESSPKAAASPTAAGRVFRYGFSRSGHDGNPAPGKLRRLWAFDPGGGRYHLSSPIVSRGRIYGATCLQDIVGAFGSVYCLDRNGNRLWEVEKVEGRELKGFFSSPAITADGKFLLIGEGLHFDKGCELLCLEAETGKVHWRFKAPLNHFESSPAVRGDLVVCGAGAIETDDGRPPDGPGFLVAIRISDGAKLWEAPVVDPESSPAIAEDGTVYVGSGVAGNAVVALRGETDEQLKAKGLDRVLWKTVVKHPAVGAVTLAGDQVLVGIGLGDYVNASSDPEGGVVCLDRHTGRKLWFADLGNVVLGAVAVRGEHGVAAVRSGELAMVRLADGAVLWKSRLSERAPLLAAPAYAGSYIYAVDASGQLLVVSDERGEVCERHQLNHGDALGKDSLSLSSPLVAGMCVYVGSETGGLNCFVTRKTKCE